MPSKPKVKFLLDENMPFALIGVLEKRGFTVRHLKKIGKAGIKNGEVYKIAEREKSWIVTRDADFENYRKFISYKIGGVILFKLSESKTLHLLNMMNRFLDKHNDKLIKKHLVLIENDGVKILS